MGKAIWEDVKKELGIRHNNGFTYENFDFKNMNSISLVTCPVHGDFKLSLNNHYYKNTGCAKCSYKRAGQRKICDWEDVKKRANDAHNKKYTYENFDFKGMEIKSWVTCPRHGDWSIHMNNHISTSKGCPYCIRKTEGILNEILKQNFNYDIKHDKRFKWCKKKRELPYDFVIEELKCIIELDGYQHFGKLKDSKWGQNPEEQKVNDILKNEKAMENGYTMIRVYQRDIFKRDPETILKLILSVNRYAEPQLICIGEIYNGRF